MQSFAARWSIEVTFEELHAHLGVGTPRQRCRRSVLRTVPWLMGLFSVVCLIFTRLWQQGQRERQREGQRSDNQVSLHHTPCYHKQEATFADALYAVRRSLWDGCLLKHVLGAREMTKLPASAKRTLITYLAEAA